MSARVFCKLTMTSRCKSGQRRYQGTFVAACRRSGRPGRRSAGSSLPWEGATHQSAASKRSLPRRQLKPREGPTGSRAWEPRAKATEGVKTLEGQPRRILRRRGRGMVGQPSWEQKRPVSAPAVRPVGCHLAGGLGATSLISRQTAKWGSAERESERPILPMKRGNARRGKGPYLVSESRGR